MSRLFWKVACCCILFLMFGTGGWAQRLSTQSEEFIAQVEKHMLASGNSEAVAVARRLAEQWRAGAYSADEQAEIIAVSQLILEKRLRPAVEWKQWLKVLVIAKEQSWASSRLKNLLQTTRRAFQEYNSQKMSLYLERVHGLVADSLLYASNFNRLYAFAPAYDFVWVDKEAPAAYPWIGKLTPPVESKLPKDDFLWNEDNGQSDKTAAEETTVKGAEPSGALIVFPKVDIIYTTPYDSVAFTNVQGVFSFEKDALIANGGTFDWNNLSARTLADSVRAAQRLPVRLELSYWVHPVKEVRFRAENTTLYYDEMLPMPLKGRFEFVSQRRNKEEDARYPLFTSYDENIRLEGLGKYLIYEGGVGLRNKRLFGFARNQNTARLQVVHEGRKYMEVHAREFLLIKNNLSAPSASFTFYMTAGDSLFHLNVAMNYSIEKGKEGEQYVIKFIREKANVDMPFIDNYHKMYISADLATYNIDANKMDFYVVGAKDRIPATFESYSYFDEERFVGLQGVQPFHPVRVLQAALDRYGHYNELGEGEIYLDALLDITRKDYKTVLGMVRQMERLGFVVYNEVTGIVKILNRTTHNYASEQYKQVMKRIHHLVHKDTTAGKPVRSLEEYAQELPESARKYVYHDFDDMLITSLSPRDARRDSIVYDTIRFKFPKEKMYLAKLEGLNVYFTKWRLQSRPDSLAGIPDTAIVLEDTLNIPNFKRDYVYKLFYELRRYDYNEANFYLDEVEGFYVLSKRFPGPPMPNATIDAEGGGLTIRGIERFDLSKKLNVAVIPKYKEIKIFGNRVIMLEEGEVTVGNFRFIGKNFVLPYEEFRLTMGEIDTMLFSVPDAENPKVKIWLGEEIRWGAGELQINYANNKSGLKFGPIPGVPNETYEGYPKLSIQEGGTIYFDQLYRQRGGYHRQKVYFKIPAIFLDSLTSKLPQFKGTFYSNFFKPLEEELQPIFDPDYDGWDSKYSLGFVHYPKREYKLYHTEGTLKTDSLVMYKTKLVALGNNEIKHLTTTVRSSRFIITSDSLVANEATFDTRREVFKGTDYPRAYGDKLKLRWITNITGIKDTVAVDSMLLFTRPNAPVTIFEETNPAAFKDGYIAITPNAFWADGILARKDFWVFSRKMRIESKHLWAKESEFRINSYQTDPFVIDDIFFYTQPAILQGNGVNIDFDLRGGICKITPVPEILQFNPEFPFITFPYAQFRTSIAEVVWDLNQQEIRMQGDSNSVFYSTKYASIDIAEAKKDLHFKASGGTYNIRNIEEPRLDLTGVPYIITADAKVIPDKGEITILRGADIQELQNAQVIVDTLRQYHHLINGKIKIQDRLSFEGRADYRYVNIAGDTFVLHFNDFELVRNIIGDTTKRRSKWQEMVYTRSTGEVKEIERFFMAPRIQFKGSVTMIAPKRGLQFDGFIKLDLQSRKDLDAWIPFKSDSGEVVIQLPEKLSVGADVLTSGLFYDPVDGVLYVTFMENKRKFTDEELFLASGELVYTAALNEFKIAPPKKVAGEQLQGNRLVFDDETAKILLDGKIRLLGESFTPYVKQAATAEVDLKGNSYKFNAFFLLDAPAPRSAFSAMGSLMVLNKPENARVAEPDPVELKWKLAEIVGDKATKTYIDAQLKASKEQMTIPLLTVDKLLSSAALVLSRVDLRWSPKERAFYSVGPIGVSNTYTQDINAAYTGYMEIQKTESGEVWHLYLQVNDEIWFYFTMQNHILRAVSSVDEFNKQFARGKRPKREGEYGFELLEPGSARLFVEDFKAKYLGGSKPQPQEKTPQEEKEDREGF